MLYCRHSQYLPITGWPYLQIGKGTSYDLILVFIGHLTWVTTRAGLLMSTNWKDTNYDSILVVIDRLTKRVHSKPAQISQCTRAGGDNFRRCNSITRSPRLSNQGSIVTSKFWSFLCCCLDVKQTTIRCSSSSADTDWCTPASWLHDSIVNNWDSVFTSKFWFFWYHFWARLRSLLMRLLREHWIEISWLHSLWHSKSLSAGALGLHVWI